MYNNFVVNSLSFGKCPLEALDNNGGVVGSWNESRPSHQLNNDAQDDYTGIIYGLHFVKNFSRYVRQQGAAINVPPQKKTKTAISQNSLDILLRNFVRLFSMVGCITTAHIYKIIFICVEMAGSEIQSTIFKRLTLR